MLYYFPTLIPALNPDLTPRADFSHPSQAPHSSHHNFHCHTQYSDGRYSPTEFLQAAADSGFTHLSITDHNSLGTYRDPHHLTFAAQLNLNLYPGVELWLDQLEVLIFRHEAIAHPQNSSTLIPGDFLQDIQHYINFSLRLHRPALEKFLHQLTALLVDPTTPIQHPLLNNFFNFPQIYQDLQANLLPDITTLETSPFLTSSGHLPSQSQLRHEFITLVCLTHFLRGRNWLKKPEQIFSKFPEYDHRHDPSSLLAKHVYSLVGGWPFNKADLSSHFDFSTLTHKGYLCLIAHPARAFSLTHHKKIKNLPPQDYQDYLRDYLETYHLNGAEADYDYEHNGMIKYDFNPDIDYNLLTFQVLQELAAIHPEQDYYFTKGSDCHMLL